MQKIILNADDFGRSPERNRAIDDSFKHGLIKSAGLIVTGKDLQDAVSLMRESGYQERVHLHFNLSTSMRDGDSEDTPLTEAMRKDSLFCENGKFRPYKRLPAHFSSIVKWRIVYHELVAQYNKFMDITEGEADFSHIDFHLWYNLTWPVAIALNLFTWKYNIKSVRYIGEHQKKQRRLRILRAISWNPRVMSLPSTNIDYFLSKRESMVKYSIIELYCHPHYKDGVFLDDSPSYLKHERQPMTKQIQSLKAFDSLEVISWEDTF